MGKKQDIDSSGKRDGHSLSLILLTGLLVLVVVLPIGLLALVVWVSSQNNWGLVAMGVGVVLAVVGMRLKPETLPRELIPSVGWLLVLSGAFGWLLSFSK